MKEIYIEMTAKYPELIDISKDKTKKSLKPVVKFVDDLEALEESMIKAFGSFSVHVMIVNDVVDKGIGNDSGYAAHSRTDKDEIDNEENEEEEQLAADPELDSKPVTNRMDQGLMPNVRSKKEGK